MFSIVLRTNRGARGKPPPIVPPTRCSPPPPLRWKKRVATEEEVEESTVAEVRPREGRVRNYRGAKKFRIERVLFRYVPSGLEKMNYALSIDESLEVNVLFESHTGPCDYQPESRRSPVRASIGTDFMDVGSARNCAKGTGRNVEFHHYRAFSLLFLGNDLNNAGFRIDSVRVRDTFIKEVRREWDLF